MQELNSKASAYDQEDPLKACRSQFYIPLSEDEQEVTYFCGNSLGLQPKNVQANVERELEKWKTQAVEGHFREPDPWFTYHKLLKQPLAHLTGAHEHEVAAMNNLTTNLHLMMVSFYRPAADRYKILMEAGAFPSDQYAVESQVKYHGFDPEKAIIELKPESGEEVVSMQSVLQAIEEHADSLALVLMPGIQYYSGQFFDLEAITRAAHGVGAKAGFDLAHAIGNVPLQLHEWGVDFAVWCSYKYLNAGPGNNGGAFVHERYADDSSLPRFAGWWGHKEAERFQMKKGFRPMYGADGWQLSNVNILSMAAQRAALEIIGQAGIHRMREKSIRLTGFLEECIRAADPAQQHIKIITPAQAAARGCQLSLSVADKGKLLFEQLTKSNIIVDWREPDIIRVAPVPLYNTFKEVSLFGQTLKAMLHDR